MSDPSRFTLGDRVRIVDGCEFVGTQPHEWFCVPHELLVVAAADEPVACRAVGTVTTLTYDQHEIRYGVQYEDGRILRRLPREHLEPL